ncbi:hypothetical protein BASA83_001562 [Batrachochytrium salamandrivorans]|nr:hypothetical protein BASA83_001562 [Batrachochytrium salamandrivorans]
MEQRSSQIQSPNQPDPLPRMRSKQAKNLSSTLTIYWPVSQTNIPASRLRFGASTATEKEQRDSTSGDLLGLFSSGFMSSQISTMVHILHITANRNNTIATFTDDAGDAGYQAVLALTEKVKERNIPISDGVFIYVSLVSSGLAVSKLSVPYVLQDGLWFASLILLLIAMLAVAQRRRGVSRNGSDYFFV